MDAGYRVIAGANDEEILARKYRIRLRGIDAPESSMPFGKEAKEALVKLVQGKCLKVLVYGDDRYRRCVGDIYFNSVYIQEQMLKKGLAWHYVAYDQRPELAKVILLFHGRRKQELNVLAYGLLHTLRSHGNGGKREEMQHKESVLKHSRSPVA
ncbi:hypothetical protein ZIOFF_013484 [Zingiber officinale]|uniref:TNase-like domain-containing protein n=1 Tax=Zingiber officinale TaxID=94328 RepID=A0A8J5LQA5_ZINOF|nr:hypothetical protein ZIOFF_013484 [Zingiber officinale]